MPKLIALKTFPYGGRRLKPNDAFTAVSAQDARLLIAIGRAKADLTPPVQTYHAAVMTAEHSEPVDEPLRPRRQYRRRDMTAEK